MRKIKKKYLGSLTIEAAIIMPIFIIAMTSILYFVKVIYIHEHFQETLTCIGEEMASQAYLFEETGLIELQKNVFQKTLENSESFYDSINTIEENYGVLKGNLQEIPELKNRKLNEVSFSLRKEESGDFITVINTTIKNLFTLKNEWEAFIQNNYLTYETILEEIGNIIKNKQGYMVNVGTQEGLSAMNNLLGSSYVKMRLNDYITKEEMTKYGLAGGNKGIRYTGSNFCLKNNDILIVINYQIKTPFDLFLPKGIKMRQAVRVKAFVGNGNFIETYQEKKETEDVTHEEVVYATMNSNVYHKYRDCYHIKDSILAVPYGDIKKDKTICEVCAKKNKHINNSTIVYTTQKSNRFHTEKNCFTINTACYVITLEKAKASGMRECKTCHKKGEKKNE